MVFFSFSIDCIGVKKQKVLVRMHNLKKCNENSKMADYHITLDLKPISFSLKKKWIVRKHKMEDNIN